MTEIGTPNSRANSRIELGGSESGGSETVLKLIVRI
jgi:hypothetical protein